MHRFHSISIRILFSKHGSPFASFTFHMLSHKYTMDFNAGITRIKRTKRKTRPKRSIRSLGMGWSLPRGPASNPTTSGVSRFSVWPFAEQIGWKPFLLTFFTTFFQSTGKKHLRLGWLKRTSHTPAKPKSCCCIPEPVMKNAWENSSMMLDKTWWWCFFVLFFSRQGLLASYWSWVDWWEWKLKKVKSQWRNNGSGMSWNFAYLSVSLKVDVLNLIDSVASSNSSTSWKQTCHITCVFFRNIPCFSCLISTRCPWDIIYKTPHKSGHQPRFPSTPMIGLHRWWEATDLDFPEIRGFPLLNHRLGIKAKILPTSDCRIASDSVGPPWDPVPELHRTENLVQIQPQGHGHDEMIIPWKIHRYQKMAMFKKEFRRSCPKVSCLAIQPCVFFRGSLSTKMHHFCCVQEQWNSAPAPILFQPADAENHRFIQ